MLSELLDDEVEIVHLKESLVLNVDKMLIGHLAHQGQATFDDSCQLMRDHELLEAADVLQS